MRKEHPRSRAERLDVLNAIPGPFIVLIPILDGLTDEGGVDTIELQSQL